MAMDLVLGLVSRGFLVELLRVYTPVTVNYVTGLNIDAAYNAHKALAGVPVMAMALVKPAAINYGILVNSFATNAVKTTQTYSSRYVEITRIDPAEKTQTVHLPTFEC